MEIDKKSQTQIKIQFSYLSLDIMSPISIEWEISKCSYLEKIPNFAAGIKIPKSYLKEDLNFANLNKCYESICG